MSVKNTHHPSRKEITSKLTSACTHYWVHRRYGVHQEVGVLPWGRRRVDIVAMNMHGHIVICEVKSCYADFKSDKKFEQYLPFCNKMFFVVPYNSKSWLKGSLSKLKTLGIGVMILDNKTGYTRVVVNAKNRGMDAEIYQSLLLRLAWRGADKSRRNTPRRRRIFL